MKAQVNDLILVIDQGTSSSRASLVDISGRIVSSARRKVDSIYPRPGWVEQDPELLLASVFGSVRQLLSSSGVELARIIGVGIANQRETTVAWDRKSGKPFYNALVWQSRQSTAYCEALVEAGYSELIRDRSGLVVDPYFSGTKMRWILDHVPAAREAARRGELAFGTIDSWIVWALTGGRTHITDVVNASRTMLFNIDTLDWDDELLRLLEIPRSVLPLVVANSGEVAFTCPASFFGLRTTIAGLCGDQQAALFGQACFSRGMAKCTYGTGAFVLMNTGSCRARSSRGLVSTVAWKLKDKCSYALEGSAFVACEALDWITNQVGLLDRVEDSDLIACGVSSCDGVYFVPALTGLGAPYWASEARGAFLGMTLGTTRVHLVRAVLESLAYQTRDLIETFEADCGAKVEELRIDGGAAVNDFLAQFQCDVLSINVSRARQVEATTLGAAFFAGLGLGVWEDFEELGRMCGVEDVFRPAQPKADVDALYYSWKRAVDSVLRFADGERAAVKSERKLTL